MTQATIYVTNWCPYCHAAKRFLADKGIAFDEHDVTGDDAARAELRTRTGRHTVPQIWIGETHVGGYDDLVALDRRGGLAPLLGA